MINPRTLALPCFVLVVATALPTIAEERRPNILLAISDDQSWPHASAYGSKMVNTPNFDRIAREGVLFNNAFCGSPGCSPSRAALLTGLNTWQVEHAGTHASYFHPKFETYPDRLAAAGYFVGHTGKGWGPGDFKQLGREHNPAGPRFDPPSGRAGPGTYAQAFEHFLTQRDEGQPFCFWFGSRDPHRSYEKGSGLAKGKTLEQAEVPPFLPDTPEVRSDLLDYAFEVERFDDDLGEILNVLQEFGELENTLIIVTSDNGMPFPRAKANCFEYGIHMPLAIAGPTVETSGREIDDLVGFTDLTATIYEAAGVDPPSAHPLAGRSLTAILRSSQQGTLETDREAVFSARERHSSSRFNTLGYPQRCIRTQQYLYIRNFKPNRWPAGAPQKYSSVVYSQDGNVLRSQLGPLHGGYHDIDGCPTLTELIDRRQETSIAPFFELAIAKRPAEELYDIAADPGCLNNLAQKREYQNIRRGLSERLDGQLSQTGDPRSEQREHDIWETYPRVSHLRWFPEPDWAQSHSGKVPFQTWLEKNRRRE